MNYSPDLEKVIQYELSNLIELKRKGAAPFQEEIIKKYYAKYDKLRTKKPNKQAFFDKIVQNQKKNKKILKKVLTLSFGFDILLVHERREPLNRAIESAKRSLKTK